MQQVNLILENKTHATIGNIISKMKDTKIR